jgi:hypothetical protein
MGGHVEHESNEKCIYFSWITSREGNSLKDRGMDGSIILKFILRNRVC